MFAKQEVEPENWITLKLYTLTCIHSVIEHEFTVVLSYFKLVIIFFTIIIDVYWL